MSLAVQQVRLARPGRQVLEALLGPQALPGSRVLPGRLGVQALRVLQAPQALKGSWG